MKNLFSIIAFILLLIPASTAWAQQDARQELAAVMAKLKALKTYHYRTATHAIFPTGETDDLQAELYMDQPNKRLYYRTDNQVLLLNRQWAYKADLKHKAISVFNIERYNDRYKKYLPELGEIFESNMAASMLDSAILGSARTISLQRKGNISTFRIGFPEGFYVQEFTLAYDNSKKLPASIRIKAFYADGSGKGTTYETISDHYSQTVPDAVFDASRYFRVSGGKVLLQQYKSYHLSSIL